MNLPGASSGAEQGEELTHRSTAPPANVESDAEIAGQAALGASGSVTGALAKVPPEVLDRILAQNLHVADHLAISWTCGFFRKIYDKDTLVALAPAEYQKFRSPAEKIADARRRATIVTSYLKSVDADPAVQADGPDSRNTMSSQAPQAVADPAVDAVHTHIPYGIMRRRMEDSVAAWLGSTVGKGSDFGQCPAFSASASLDQTRAWLISTIATRHMSKMQAMQKYQLLQGDLDQLPTVVRRRLDSGNGLVLVPRSGLVRMYYEATIRSFVMRQYNVASLDERAALVKEMQAAAKARKRSFGELVSVCPQEVANSPMLKFKKRRIEASGGELQHN